MTVKLFAAVRIMCIVAISVVAHAAFADSAADFYKDKSLIILVAERSATDTMADFYRGKAAASLASLQEDSPYDLTARNAAVFLHKYMPGNPEVSVQNMPGAAGSRAAEYLAGKAPRDGTVVLVAEPAIVLNQLLTPSPLYRVERFSWLGRVAPLAQVGFVSATAGIASVEDAKMREIVMGAEGPSGAAAIMPWALNRLTGTHFKVVRGYIGSTELFIALQRGEIQGMGSVGLDMLAEKGWLAQGQADVLYALSNERLASLPDVPAVTELARDERGRAVLSLIASIPDIGVTIAAPPDVPAGRVASLRTAFAVMVKDPDFIKNERRLGINVDPLAGEVVEAIVKRAAAAPPDLVAALKAAIEPMN
jgi:tripartite-type tricarboxylate transporter receptor subunit TctC